MNKLLRALGIAGLVLFTLLVTSGMGAGGQGGVNRPQFVNGEMMITVQQGMPRADVDKLAATVNATVAGYFGALDPLKPIECYWLHMTDPKTSAADTLAAVTKLKADPHVTYAGPNLLYYSHDSIP